MIILGIETSCDETAAAVVEGKIPPAPLYAKGAFRVLSNVVASQIKVHAPWGGVVPNLAKREHLKNLPIVCERALEAAWKKCGQGRGEKWKIPPSPLYAKGANMIDFIAVTVGPGLEPALWTGINFAQELAKKWNKPIIAVNHMEGHIFSVLLNRKEFPISNPPAASLPERRGRAGFQFPILALLVSGGHTELVLMRKWRDYKIIGSTRDDAAGEAFDKAAKMLGLEYPGGPAIAKYAEQFEVKHPQISNFKFLISKQIPISKSQKITPTPPPRLRYGETGLLQRGRITLPRPMISSKDYDFSFSGLKTALLYAIKKNPPSPPLKRGIGGINIPEYAHEFQQAVIDVLVSKTLRAAKEFKAKTIILAGGVAANKKLREQLKNQLSAAGNKAKLLMPDIKFTGDNAAMIALAAYFHAAKKQSIKPENLKAEGNLEL